MNRSILSIDPSGTGTTALCLINEESVAFAEIKNKDWKEHLNFIVNYIQQNKPDQLIYEHTNYINLHGKDMTSLFKLFGAIECLTFFFTLAINNIPVNQVKDLYQKLYQGREKLTDLTYQAGRGKGWTFQGKRISIHQLDAFLVYWIWRKHQEKK